MRAALYAARRYDLGCPRDGVCELHSKFGKEVPCGPEAKCHNFIPVHTLEPNPLTVPRIEFLTRLSNLVHVGCRFSLTDLDWGTWDELIVLEQERQWLDAQVDKQRDLKSKGGPAETPQAQKQVADLRKSLGAPAPGQSFFK